MRYPAGRILIFAKAPRPGGVKTRLIPQLGADGAAQLHRTLARTTVATAARAAVAPITLWCAPDADDAFFLELQTQYALTLRVQQGDDLGARMQFAFEMELREAAYAVALGTDWPELNADVLHEACTALDAGTDAVLVPTEDGGYALLGLRRCDARLFENVVWGGAEVMAQTRARLAVLGWTWRELATSWDLDRPDDLQRARRAGLLP
jgi:hypothetical protein